MTKQDRNMIIVCLMAAMVFGLLVAFVTFWSGHTQVRDFGYQTTYWLIITGLFFVTLLLIQRIK